MNIGNQKFLQLLQETTSPDTNVRKKAEQALTQMKTVQPALFLSKLMDAYNNESDPSYQLFSAITLSFFLKNESHLLPKDMLNPLTEFALNAFPTVPKFTTSHLTIILFALYKKYKSSFGDAATSYTQRIEESMIGLLTSADPNSQLKGAKLAECFLGAGDKEVKIPEELKKNVTNELVNLLHSQSSETSRKAFEVLASYGELTEGKHDTALFTKAVKGMIDVLKQTFADDASLGEDLLLKLANVLCSHQKAFQEHIDAILGVLGFVKNITPETMQNQGLSIFQSLIKLIPGEKRDLFYEFVLSVVNTIQDALNEVKKNEKYITALEEILVSCTEIFVQKNDTVINKLMETSSMLLKSTDWKATAAGLILLATIYRVSKDSMKDQENLNICLELTNSESPHIRFYAYKIIGAVLNFQSIKITKKNYKELLDKYLEQFASVSQSLKLSVARILQAVFSQKKNLKIPEDDLETYFQKVFVIVLENFAQIQQIDSDSIIYLELLDAIFDWETEAKLKQEGFIDIIGNFLEIIMSSSSLAIGQKLRGLSILFKFVAIFVEDELKRNAKQILTAVLGIIYQSVSELYIKADPKEYLNGIIILWTNYVKLYGLEAMPEIGMFWEALRTLVVTPVKGQHNYDLNENNAVGGYKELNDVPFDCVDSLKGFVSEIIKCYTFAPEFDPGFGNVFAQAFEDMLVSLVTQVHKYTCYAYQSTISLKELCTQVYEWDYREDPGRALTFISTIVIKLIQSFKKLIQRKDPYDVSAVVIFVNHIVKTVKDLPKQTLLEILDAFPGEILKECELRLEEYKTDENKEEEKEDKGERANKQEKKKLEKVSDDEESENSEDESFDEEDEPAGNKEYVWDLIIEICEFWGQLIERLQGEASELAEYIVKNVILTWLNKKGHYKERSVGYHSMFAILDNMEPQFIPNGFWSLAEKFYENSTVDHQGERHNCAFGLGVLAQKAPTVFVKVGEMVLKRLFEMTEDKKRSTTGMKIYNKYIDNVYSAIGKALANNPQFMKDDYVENWLKYLPLKYDDDESKIMFSEMCKMAENKECVKGLMGKNGQFYDLVIKKFDESIESEFCDKETGDKLLKAKSKLISQKGQN